MCMDRAAHSSIRCPGFLRPAVIQRQRAIFLGLNHLTGGADLRPPSPAAVSSALESLTSVFALIEEHLQLGDGFQITRPACRSFDFDQSPQAQAAARDAKQL